MYVPYMLNMVLHMITGTVLDYFNYCKLLVHQCNETFHYHYLTLYCYEFYNRCRPANVYKGIKLPACGCSLLPFIQRLACALFGLIFSAIHVCNFITTYCYIRYCSKYNLCLYSVHFGTLMHFVCFTDFYNMFNSQ